MAKTWLRVDDDGLLAESVECISCGADLKGASPSGRCHKCQDHVLDSLAGMGLAQVDGEGRIEEDIACAVCRYNLRSKQPEGDCPECGADIAPSLEGLPIRYFGRKWLNRMSRGALLYFIAGIVGPVLGVSAAILRIVTQDEAVLATYQMTVSVLVMAIGLPALWLLTSPLPRRALGQSSREVGAGMRETARYVGILGYIMGTIQAVVPVFFPVWGLVGGLIAMPVGAISFGTLFTHLGRTARSIPDEGLVKHARIVTWLMIASIAAAFIGLSIVTTGVVLAGIPVESLQNLGADPDAAEAMRPYMLFLLGGGLISALGGLGSLVSTVYSLILTFIFRRRFAAAAKMIPLERKVD